MIVIRDPFKSADLPKSGIVTVGNFDGVHLGHQKLLRDVVARAGELGVSSVVVTFDPHPLKVLRPEEAPKMIQTLRQREEAMEACGIDALLIVPFTRDFSLTPAETFVGELLVKRLAAREVHVGERFAFGRDKQGNLDRLSRACAEAGTTVAEIADVADGSERVSSTRIRAAVDSGDVALATRLLGRPYAMDGFVARGDRMGRKIGFPTINLKPENELFPVDGVYLTTMYLPSFQRTFGCVTNIGRRPTVYEDYATTIESYVLDFSSDVYGERIRLAFLGRLREERVFPSMLELTAQIRRDVEATRLYFARNPVS
jgi:riboflavin kinase/FMN adenylyltransferase